jgi:L-glyceraldehyde 3-phosphate reductase
LRQQAAQVQFVAHELGISMARAAFRFVREHNGATTALGGFSSLTQLEELTAVSGMKAIPTDLLNRLEAVWRRNLTKRSGK